MGGGESVVPIVRPALDDLDHVVFNAVDDAVGVVEPTGGSWLGFFRLMRQMICPGLRLALMETSSVSITKTDMDT